MATTQDIATALINIATNISKLAGVFQPGTIATQNANNVAITGGSLSDVTVAETSANGLTATGTTRVDAFVVTAQINRFSTVGAGTGAVITFAPGLVVAVYNDGVNPLQVYASGSTTIDGVAGSTGVPLTNAKRCLYTCVATNVVVSAQLGVVSS